METETVTLGKPFRNPNRSIPEIISRNNFKPSDSSQRIVSGFKKEIIELLVRIKIFRIVISNYKSPLTWIKVLKRLDENRRKILGEHRIKKVAVVDHKHYWDLYTPAWNSRTFNHFIEGELNRIIPLNRPVNRFTNVFIAITKKCSLECEHCFEWEALNKKEKLSIEDLKKIVSKITEKGSAQIQLTGGEPLLRINDIIELLETSKKDTDFWILSSGFNLTIENARKLKSSGLRGMMVSLDHFDGELHNQFRGFSDSFEWVQHAVKNAIEAGLVAGLSLCATKSFISEENLLAYADLAKTMGVSFIQILEPKAVGHYQGKDVLLNSSQEKILEDFYLQLNYKKQFKKYPIVAYHGYHQRRSGCFGSGNRNLYVDTDGDVHACPFCQQKTGSILTEDLDSTLEKLRVKGCHSFKAAII